MAEPRNAEEAASINPQADAFAKAKLRMLEEERAFEDWWTSQPGGSGVGAYSDLAKAAQATHRSFARLGWMARVREVDRLQKVCHDSSAVIENVLEANRTPIQLGGALQALAIALHREWAGDE